MEPFELILKRNSRYIKYMANKLCSYDDSQITAELIQIGTIALWRAYQTYDETLGIPFMKYAGKFIKWDQIKYLNVNGRTVYTPKNQLASGGTHTISLNHSIGEGDGVLSDILAEEVEEPLLDDDGLESLLIALQSLSPRNREIIEYKFGLNGKEELTLEQIGQLFGGLTKEGIRLIVVKSLKKLRLNFPQLKEFLISY